MRNEISAQERRKHSARIDRALSTSRQATSGHAADDQLKVSDQRVPLVKVAVTARPPRHRQRTDRIEPEVAWQRCTQKKNNPAAFPYRLRMHVRGCAGARVREGPPPAFVVRILANGQLRFCACVHAQCPPGRGTSELARSAENT